MRRSQAVYPSGPRGRIANPLFVGSNPTAAFGKRWCHELTRHTFWAAWKTFHGVDCGGIQQCSRRIVGHGVTQNGMCHWAMTCTRTLLHVY
jgi:hypothetical protein